MKFEPDNPEELQQGTSVVNLCKNRVLQQQRKPKAQKQDIVVARQGHQVDVQEERDEDAAAGRGQERGKEGVDRSRAGRILQRSDECVDGQAQQLGRNVEEESEAERLDEPAVTRSACGAVAEGEGLLIVAFICDIVDDMRIERQKNWIMK